MGIFTKQLAFEVLKRLVNELDILEIDNDADKYFAKRKKIINNYKQTHAWKENVLDLCGTTGMSQDEMIEYAEEEINPDKYNIYRRLVFDMNSQSDLYFEQHRKHKKHHVKKSTREAKTVTSGNLPESLFLFGGYEWQILAEKNGNMLLISKDVLHIHTAYNNELAKVDWETCTLRKWLNEEFYGFFNGQEQERVLPTTNLNLGNPWYGTKGSNKTEDKIFLLSVHEVVKYFGNSGDLDGKRRHEHGGDGYYLDENGPFLHDKYNKERIANYIDSPAWWWLRTPGHSGRSAAIVSDSGNVVVGGGLVDYTFGRIGVRPALWLGQ